VRVYNSQGKVAAALASILGNGVFSLFSSDDGSSVHMQAFNKLGGHLTLYGRTGKESFTKP